MKPLLLMLVCLVAGFVSGCGPMKEAAPDAPQCHTEVNAMKLFNGGGDTTEVVPGNSTRLAIVTVRPGRLEAQAVHDSKLCTGTVIAHGWILTAAHCIVAEVIRVGFGWTGTMPAAEVEVAGVWEHPTLDVAVLQLGETRLTEELGIEPIRLWQHDVPAGWIDASLTLAGRGLTEAGGVGELLFAEERVSAIYEDSVEVDGMGMSGACVGDSGGPLLAHEPRGALRVVGTLSAGSPSCLDRDIYVRADVVAPWIRQLVGDAVDPEPVGDACRSRESRSLSASPMPSWRDLVPEEQRLDGGMPEVAEDDEPADGGEADEQADGGFDQTGPSEMGTADEPERAGEARAGDDPAGTDMADGQAHPVPMRADGPEEQAVEEDVNASSASSWDEGIHEGDRGADGGGSAPATGDEGQACYPNHTCHGTLTCASNLCVQIVDAEADADADGDGDSGVPDERCWTRLLASSVAAEKTNAALCFGLDQEGELACTFDDTTNVTACVGMHAAYVVEWDGDSFGEVYDAHGTYLADIEPAVTGAFEVFWADGSLGTCTVVGDTAHLCVQAEP